MSSVLKAMKKIEKEPLPVRGPVSPGDVEKIVFGQRSGSRRHPFVWLFLPSLTVFLLSVLVYLYNEQIFHNEVAAVPPVIAGEAVAPVQYVLPANGTTRPDRHNSNETLVSSPKRDMKEMAAAGNASHETSSPQNEKVAPATGLQDAGTVAGETLSEAKSLSNGTKLYKVHGISWSDDPARRIAVVNSSVVHEGERLAHGVVVRIHKNSVVIKRGDTLYNVPF